MLRRQRIVHRLLCSLLATTALTNPSPTHGQEPVRDGDWLIQRDEQRGINILISEMTIHPQGEPRPALRYRLLHSRENTTEGNSALFYLKAMGFFEQNSARIALHEFQQNARKKAEAEGVEIDKTAPYVWHDMAPKDLPRDEVKTYLSYLAFQPFFLEEASKRRGFSFDRNIEQQASPMEYLLPEIQQMRELARTQCVRCRLAIAEDRIDDALQILRQQYSLATHLGTDEFLVSTLVGAAISGIAWGDLLHFIQHPDAPNLYWAIAELPEPLIDMKSAFSYERRFLLEQCKVLKEVDEKIRPAGYWNDFIDRLVPQLAPMASELSISNDPDSIRLSVVGWVAASYPSAKRYLIERCNMDPKQVSTYPTSQTVFLALTRSNDEFTDRDFKWMTMPMWKANLFRVHEEKAFQAIDAKAGWLTVSRAFSATPSASHTAQQRIQQTLAMAQTVEAIRMYGAKHGRTFPQSLSELPVPAPIDPLSGLPFAYEANGNQAILTGGRMPGLQYRLVLRFASDR